MLKINKTLSTQITLVLAYIMLFIMAALTLSLPWVWRFITLFFNIGWGHYIVSLLLLYPAAVLGVTTCVLIIKLLNRVNRGEVFTEKSVSIIRGISWCCIGVSPLFFTLGFFFVIFFVISFLTAFLGLIVRAVKNVMEDATQIKYENDLTV